VIRAFGAWARGEAPAAAVGAAPQPSPRTIYLIDKPGAAQSVVRIGHGGSGARHARLLRLQVLNTILGGAFTSRLNQNLRETHGYTSAPAPRSRCDAPADRSSRRRRSSLQNRQCSSNS